MATGVFINPSTSATNPFNQSLDTTNDVAFARVSIVDVSGSAGINQILLDKTLTGAQTTEYYQLDTRLTNNSVTPMDRLNSLAGYIKNTGGGVIDHAYSLFMGLENDLGTMNHAYGCKTYVYNDATITSLYHYYAELDTFGGGTVTNSYVYYAPAMTQPVNSYSFWSDEQGVYRIKSDNTFNSVYQAIPALYNPQFTKYTPGAVNYERVVQQWNSNVMEIGNEAGGTGTLRKLRFIGAGILTNATILPTSNPGVTGQLWNDGGTVKVS